LANAKRSSSTPAATGGSGDTYQFYAPATPGPWLLFASQSSGDSTLQLDPGHRHGRGASLQPRLRPVPVSAAQRATVWVLVNHFKSQSGGGGPKRARQAQGVRTIVEELVAAGERHIVVLGDLNEGPTVLGQPAANLTSLVDPNGPRSRSTPCPPSTRGRGPRPGTFQSCGIRNRLDYILVSQDLAGLVVGGGIERHGLWGTPTSVNPPAQWDICPQITGAHQTASDHAAIYVDINI
jgi:Endonuclease/Exonuclease/phosphatase family